MRLGKPIGSRKLLGNSVMPKRREKKQEPLDLNGWYRALAEHNKRITEVPLTEHHSWK